MCLCHSLVQDAAGLALFTGITILHGKMARVISVSLYFFALPSNNCFVEYIGFIFHSCNLATSSYCNPVVRHRSFTVVLMQTSLIKAQVVLPLVSFLSQN